MEILRAKQSTAWWETPLPANDLPKLLRAVAYYRHSAQDRQENSVAIQQEQVRQWARENGILIVQEFADRGKSGLTAEGRDEFNEMMSNWVRVSNDIQFVLCLDVSRWGRFQDIDLSATYSAECKQHGKQVVYTTLGKPKENDQLYQVHVHFERYRAAQYSKELSDKVHRGCLRIAQQGYWAGGKPPYGLQRLLLDESRRPLQTLSKGQRKSIQNQRVILTTGSVEQTVTIKRIFEAFVDQRKSTKEISDALNYDGVSSPGGFRWDSSKVRRILKNELYVGTMLYNRTTQKLKTASHANPISEWIRKREAFAPIVTSECFGRAQERLLRESALCTSEFMIENLRRFHSMHGTIWPSLLKSDPESPTIRRYVSRFGSLDAAYQAVFEKTHSGVRGVVEGSLRSAIKEVESYHDFLVINRKFTVYIQPSVPVPFGYTQYWYFRPDTRRVVDITLGVPLANHNGAEILGYFALPRLLMRQRSFRLYESAQVHVDMYGSAGLDVILQLASDT